MKYLLTVLLSLTVVGCMSEKPIPIADIPTVLRGDGIDAAIRILGKPNRSSQGKRYNTHSATFYRPPIQIQIFYHAKTRKFENIYVSNMFSPALTVEALKAHTGLIGDTDSYWLEVRRSPKTSLIIVTPGRLSETQSRARQIRAMPSDAFQLLLVSIPYSEQETKDLAANKYTGAMMTKQFDTIQDALVEYGLGRISVWATVSSRYEYVLQVFDTDKAASVLTKALKGIGVPRGTEIRFPNSRKETLKVTPPPPPRPESNEIIHW